MMKGMKVQNELFVVYCIQLLEEENSRCRVLLRDDKAAVLSRMYRLFRKIPKGLVPVANIFKQHVIAESTALVQQEEDAASNKVKTDALSLIQVFVRKVIELHDKYMAYVNDFFANHSLFHKALTEAFEVFCNESISGFSSAELLASFCDNILKGGSEKWSDEANKDTLDKVVKLLSYISDKDLFAEFYRKKRSLHLIFDKSANDNHERIILSKLKQRWQFISKTERMATDSTLASENQNHFEEYLEKNSNANPGIDLTVTILATGFWPTYKSSYLSLPAEILKSVEVFKEFYQTKTKHRKFTWIYSSSTCIINSKFEQKAIELMMGTYQKSRQLNLVDDDLVRVFQSLSCADYKILRKEPDTETVTPIDYFELNPKFTDKRRDNQIPLLPVDERKKVVEDIDKDRRYAIDASIVRIMKSHKPNRKAIKERIEDLITHEFLERDKENPNLSCCSCSSDHPCSMWHLYSSERSRPSNFHSSLPE
ncbi:hypothetical protein ACSBR1_021778 [Camellia fascicularis]